MLRRIILSASILLAQPVVGAEVERLDWMTGCWSSQRDGRLGEECWLHPAGGVMLGVNRKAGAEGTAFEFLRIARDGDDLVYFASPSGKTPTPFRLVEIDERRAVFANPDHDFPQRITYRREGERLTARVEARDGAGWKGFELIWHRSSIEGPRTSSSRQSLGEAERAFARSVAESDSARFASFIADDAVFVGDVVLRGKPAIVEGWSVFFGGEAAPRLAWEPELVEVRERGDLGLTRGSYALTGTAPDGTERTQSGTFTSIWEALPDGSWRIVFDEGCPADP